VVLHHVREWKLPSGVKRAKASWREVALDLAKGGYEGGKITQKPSPGLHLII